MLQFNQLTRKAGLSHKNLQDVVSQQYERLPIFLPEVAGLTVDCSNQLCNLQTFQELLYFAEMSGLANEIKKIHKGVSHWRYAGHLKSRDFSQNSTQQHLSAIEELVTKIRNSQITDIVHLGIGGSYLGPLMTHRALSAFVSGPRCHFVANLDAAAIYATLNSLDPEKTLVIAVSKTFLTEEMLTNLTIVTEWLSKRLSRKEVFRSHMVAVTSFSERAERWGFFKDQILNIPQNVGGRYSLWSSVGFTLAIALGMDLYKELLLGAYAMDEHFFTSALSNNIPVVLALLSIWYQNFLKTQTHAVISYAEPLSLLTEYLQQLNMESLGKSVTLDGQRVDYKTGSIVWGGIGTNAQHAVQQLILQGTHLIPTDFIVVKKRTDISSENAQRMYIYAQAQIAAMTKGLSQEEAFVLFKHEGYSDEMAKEQAPHRMISQHQPTQLFILSDLRPRSLGALLATYEHKVLVQAALWGINPFDQWGVEFGKKYANSHPV